ncbi:MAG: hypothetical protein ACLFQS_11655 [Bacteroidales bacterium]
MKQIVQITISILFLILILNASAQDRIVTHDNEAIKCRITNVDEDYIYFSFMQQGEMLNTLIDRKDVISYQYNFYDTYELKEDKVIGNEYFPFFRISLGGGVSYITAKISPEVPYALQDYTQELKSGFHFGGMGTFFINQQVGLGLQANLFSTSNSIDNVQIPGLGARGLVRDDVTVTFIAPMLSTRILSRSKKSAFYSHLGIGYLGYVNDAILILPLDLKGNTIGFSGGVGGDIGLSDHLALKISLSYVIGALSKITVSNDTMTETVDLEEDQVENLSRIDFSIGLSFR